MYGFMAKSSIAPLNICQILMRLYLAPQIFRPSYSPALRRRRLKAVDEDEIKQVEMKKNFIFAMFGAHRRSPAKLNRKRRDSNFRQMTYKKFARVDKYSDYFLGSV